MNSTEAIQHPVVQASIKVCAAIRRAIPKIFEHPDLCIQMERAALSVGSNWMEGIGRRGTSKSPQQFYRIARGSGYELAFQLAVAGLADLLVDVHAMCDLMEAEADFIAD